MKESLLVSLLKDLQTLYTKKEDTDQITQGRYVDICMYIVYYLLLYMFSQSFSVSCCVENRIFHCYLFASIA